MDQSFLEEQLRRIRRLTEQMSEVHHRVSEGREAVIARTRGGRGRWPPEDDASDSPEASSTGARRR